MKILSSRETGKEEQIRTRYFFSEVNVEKLENSIKLIVDSDSFLIPNSVFSNNEEFQMLDKYNGGGIIVTSKEIIVCFSSPDFHQETKIDRKELGL